MMSPDTVVTVEHSKPAQPQQAPQPQGQQGNVLDNLQIDYFKAPPGILKLVELVLGILGMATVPSNYWAGSGWFCFVAVSCFITTVIWAVIYLFNLRQSRLCPIPVNWVASELLVNGIETILYLIAFIVQFAATAHLPASLHGSSIAAAVFGMFNTAAYAGSTYYAYLDHRLMSDMPTSS